MNNLKPSVKKLLVKLNLAFQGNSLRYLNQLNHWQWLDKDQLSALQHKRIDNLLLHAYDHVPYYREVLRSAGVVNASGAVNLKSFDKIPLLDKAKICSHFEDLKSGDLFKRKWHKNSSGGSTGEPVTFIQDSVYTDWRSAIKILYDSWTGYSITAKKIRLWGSMRDLSVSKEKFITRFIQWLNNDILLNAFRMTPDEMSAYVRKINDFKPVQILSYAESIYELSCFIEQEGLTVFSPRSIMTSAGTLFPPMREKIEQIFKAPIFNRYGAREVGDVACECEKHSGLHVSSPTHYLEILMPDGKPAEPGEVGEIIVTSLINFAMPFIRYRIGDMGMWSEEPCSCGRNWPLLKEVKGRMSDTFLTKDGAKIYGAAFTVFFFFLDWIKKYQVVQEEYDHIRVPIVTKKRVSNPLKVYELELKSITNKFLSVLGQDCKVEYEFVNDIEPTDSGKYRYTISKLAK